MLGGAMADPGHQPRRRLPGLGAVLGDPIGEARSLLGALPEIAGYLRAVSRDVGHMDREVTGMHAAVERLDLEVKALRQDIAAVAEGLDVVADRVERLEPHVADLSRLSRPLQRMRSRIGGGHQRPASAARAADELEDPGQLPAAGAADGDNGLDPADSNGGDSSPSSGDA